MPPRAAARAPTRYTAQEQAAVDECRQHLLSDDVKVETLEELKLPLDRLSTGIRIGCANNIPLHEADMKVIDKIAKLCGDKINNLNRLYQNAKSNASKSDIAKMEAPLGHDKVEMWKLIEEFLVRYRSANPGSQLSPQLQQKLMCDLLIERLPPTLKQIIISDDKSFENIDELRKYIIANATGELPIRWSQTMKFNVKDSEHQYVTEWRDMVSLEAYQLLMNGDDEAVIEQRAFNENVDRKLNSPDNIRQFIASLGNTYTGCMESINNRTFQQRDKPTWEDVTSCFYRKTKDMNQHKSNSTTPSSTGKHCHICQEMGKSDRVIKSHNTNDCNSVPKRKQVRFNEDANSRKRPKTDNNRNQNANREYCGWCYKKYGRKNNHKESECRNKKRESETTTTKDGSKIICYECKEEGHRRTECPELKAKRGSDSNSK